MKKAVKLEVLLLVFALASPVWAQEPRSAQPLNGPVVIHSTPFYVKGIGIPVIRDEAHGIEMTATVVKVMRKRYIQIQLVLTDSDHVNFDFDPYGEVTMVLGDTVLEPMPPREVAALAKSIVRRKIPGIMAGQALGSWSASAYSQYSTTNTYEQERTDEMTDAAIDDANSEYAMTRDTLLLRNTVTPRSELVGEVYFRIPKEMKGVDTSGMMMSVRLPDGRYLLQF